MKNGKNPENQNCFSWFLQAQKKKSEPRKETRKRKQTKHDNPQMTTTRKDTSIKTKCICNEIDT